MKSGILAVLWLAIMPSGRVNPARAFLGITLALGGSACVSQYAPPTVDEPHAIVKFKRRYEKLRGTSLREVLLVGGEQAFVNDDRPSHAARPRTDAVLVHPGVTDVRMTAAFTHLETYIAREPYPCGATNTPRTCYRTVRRNRTVSDGSCNRELTILFSAEKNYLLELDYQDRRNCRVRCLEQVHRSDGSFDNKPCQIDPQTPGS
jgi:hypothetical protein